MAKKGRANNGMGSIRQRSDGRWEARYTAPNGKQKSVYGKSEAEVTKKLRGVLHEIDSGAWREPSKMTISEWLDIWVSDYLTHASERTVLKYKCIVDGQLKPTVGTVKVSKLAPYHVQRMITTMVNNGLKQCTVSNYIKIFLSAMNCAVDAGIITENPVKRAKVPRVPPAKFTIIDRTDIPAFFEAAKKTPYEYELRFMILTGLRIGEVRGLRWDDIDFDSGTLHVQRQLHPKDRNLSRFTPPKYGEDRIIYLPSDAVAILKDQKRRQAEQRIARGADWYEDEISTDLVFRQRNGKAHGQKTIYNAVKNVGIAIGKPDLHPHDLRHSYAVAALRSGTDVKTVQHNLGHKTAGMTLDVYASYTSDAGKEGANKLSQYFKNAEK